MGISDAPKTVKLYLRLPVKIVDEQQVRDLHPGIVKVALPRQKSRRWCIVEFDSVSPKEGLSALKEIKVNNKKLLVTACKSKKGRKQ